MDLNEKQLRGFLAVVDHGSIGRGAAAMNMSQPALSRLIGTLESAHGVALFQRLTTGVALTPAGEALLPHAKLLLFEMGQAADTLRAIRGLKRGTVRVGAVAAVARTILPAAIGRLLEKAPQLKIELLETLDDRLLDALIGNAIDLMIVGQSVTAPEVYLMGECRFDDTYDVFCSADHPLARQRSICIDDILPGSWVMPPRGATPRVLFEKIVQRIGAPLPNVVIETSSPGAIVSCVIDTGRLGWMPVPLFAGEQAAGRVRRLHVAEFTLPRRFFVYRRARGLLPTPAQQLFTMLPLRNRP